MFIARLMPPRRSLRLLTADTAGTAGIEFALIVPFVLVLMLGALEYSRAVVMARRFNLMTATLSDLIARDDFESDATITGLNHAMQTIWSPYDAGSLVMTVVAVRQATSSATKIAPNSNYVYWSKVLNIKSGANTDGNPVCSPYTGLPANMLSPGGSTIVVNASYTYTSLFGTKIPIPGFTNSATQSWTSSSSHAPRNLCVAWNSANCSQNCE